MCPAGTLTRPLRPRTWTLSPPTAVMRLHTTPEGLVGELHVTISPALSGRQRGLSLSTMTRSPRGARVGCIEGPRHCVNHMRGTSHARGQTLALRDGAAPGFREYASQGCRLTKDSSPTSSPNARAEHATIIPCRSRAASFMSAMLLTRDAAEAQTLTTAAANVQAATRKEPERLLGPREQAGNAARQWLGPGSALCRRAQAEWLFCRAARDDKARSSARPRCGWLHNEGKATRRAGRHDPVLSLPGHRGPSQLAVGGESRRRAPAPWAALATSPSRPPGCHG